MLSTAFRIVVVRVESVSAPGKVADAELHFSGGLLEGQKLIGFGVWKKRGGEGYNVTFPARQYSVNGERRSFALLRSIVEVSAQEQLKQAIIAAYLVEAPDRQRDLAAMALCDRAGRWSE